MSSNPTRTIRLIAAAALCALLPTTAVPAAAQEAEPEPGGPAELVVGVKEAAPFSMRQPDGAWTGITIELVEAAASDLGRNVRYETYGTVEALLEATETGEVELGAGALTITPGREAVLDFSHPYYTTGLGIAVPAKASGGWLSVLEQFFSGEFLRIMAVLITVLLLVGLLVWFFERKRNDGFERGARGIGTGFWFSAVTMTTVGYGDTAPQTAAGRLVTLVWMFVSVVAISSFTAAIASTLTVGGLTGPVEGPEDLDDHGVATVDGSTSARYLEDRRVIARTFPDVQAALTALRDSDEIEAVVYDAPLLRYLVLSGDSAALDVRVLEQVFEDQFYGLALPAGSELREPLNRALLERVGGEEWNGILFRYLGQEEG